MLTAIIVAGGSSRRMGFDKTFALLGGKPVVAHSIAAFEGADSVTEIILVGREDRLAELRRVVESEKFRKVSHVLAGGAHRQESVANGLGQVAGDCRYIGVHDAARPLVTPRQIECVFESCRKEGAAALAAPISDTLKRADQERFVCESIARDGLYAMQTPQIFERSLLLEAYEFVRANCLSITDEVSAVEKLGRKVLLVPNEEVNFKITYPGDLPLAEFILAQRGTGMTNDE
jgi:2-C-methyl-D-erythritol 4-phosphate cytidylyltransferase